MLYPTATRSDSPDAGSPDWPDGSSRVWAVERRELSRDFVDPPDVLDPFTRDLAAVVAAKTVPLALWNRHSVPLRRTADVATGVDRAVVAEGKGCAGRMLPLGRAAVEPTDGLSGAHKRHAESVG